MPTTKKTYDWALKWYVVTRQFVNAAGQPTAQCGPYDTQPEADVALIKRRGKTGDPTLHVVERDINKMTIRPTLIEE